jgi:DNA-binding transcriptional MerR regulator
MNLDDDGLDATIDELAGGTGTTSRTIRSFQTMGLLERPHLHGRTGRYGARHVARLQAILRLQAQGFSLQSLAILLPAYERGQSLGGVLGLPEPAEPRWAEAPEVDTAELYGFAELQAARSRSARRQPGRRPLLAVVPSTVWDQTEAS